MGVSAQNYQTVKLLNFSFQDQDSGSTQSTGQSYSQGDSNGENDPNPRRMGFVHSDFNLARGKHAEGESKFTSSMETQNYPQLAVPFPDQYFNGVLSTFGPQAVVMPGRVPLPLDFSTSEPIYVNPKQYRGILRRRQHRAKLEAQNKLLKNRKPYLHESRHQHAVKRARGSGGRFLNKKELQQRNPSLTTAPRNISGPSSGPTHLGGPVLQENNKKGTSSTTHSCSDVTSDDNYHSLEFRFSGYSSRFLGPTSGGGGRSYVWGKTPGGESGCGLFLEGKSSLAQLLC